MAYNGFQASLMSPAIEELINKVDSKFSLVTLASKRAREINAYLAHLGGNLGSIVPPQLDSISRKPLSVAFEEIAAGLVVEVREEVTEEEGDAPAVDEFDLEGDFDLDADLEIQDLGEGLDTLQDGEGQD